MIKRQIKRKYSVIRRVRNGILLLLLCAGWFWWQQNGITSEAISVPGCPAAFDGLRIAVVSDVHGKQFGTGNKGLIKKVNALSPDLIAITGDLIHDAAQLADVPALAAGLAKIAPTYYVTGNHEWAVGHVSELKDMLEENGVNVLSNEFVLLERKEQVLALLGADDSNGRADQKTIAQLADEARRVGGEYLLLLSHRNNRYPEYAAARIDLTLAGHAHGGLVRLPFTDGLIGPQREWFPHHTAGLYELNYGNMVVSRGLGNKYPAIRIFNRPHLPLIILRAGA